MHDRAAIFPDWRGSDPRKVLAKAGLTLDDIDLFEINEAFAVVAEKYIRDLKLDRAKVNVNGAPSMSELGVRRVTRRRFPVGASPIQQPLQPEATGAAMEVTKCRGLGDVR